VWKTKVIYGIADSKAQPSNAVGGASCLKNGVSPRGETPESHFAPSQNPDVHFSIDKDRRLVVVKFEGSVTVQEIAQYVESLVAHPDFDSSFSEITDLRAVEHFDLQANDFLTLADQIDPFSLTVRRAFVVRTSA